MVIDSGSKVQTDVDNTSSSVEFGGPTVTETGTIPIKIPPTNAKTQQNETTSEQNSKNSDEAVAVDKAPPDGTEDKFKCK